MLLSAGFLPTRQPFGGIVLPAWSTDFSEVEWACLVVFWNLWAERNRCVGVKKNNIHTQYKQLICSSKSPS